MTDKSCLDPRLKTVIPWVCRETGLADVKCIAGNV